MRASSHCLTLDLAPSGVYLATPVTRGAGALLPHRFTLTCARFPERKQAIGGLFSVALSCELPRLAVSQHRCSMEPRPSSTRGLRPPGQLTVTGEGTRRCAPIARSVAEIVGRHAASDWSVRDGETGTESRPITVAALLGQCRYSDSGFATSTASITNTRASPGCTPAPAGTPSGNATSVGTMIWRSSPS